MENATQFTVRRSAPEDIPAILKIITGAQAYFQSQGVDQWQDGYPNAEVFTTDIRNGNSYVLLSGEKIVATAMISFDGEPTYSRIDGAWLTNSPYAVIHRLAVRPDLKGQGIADSIVRLVVDMCIEKAIPCIRIDTHSENLSMQRVAEKNGFQYCGIITVRDNAPRLAYEKII